MTVYEPTGEMGTDGPTTGAAASGATAGRVGIGDGHNRVESQSDRMGTHRRRVDADAVESRTTATERADRTGRPPAAPGGRPPAPIAGSLVADGWARTVPAAANESLDRPSPGRSTRRP